MGGGAREGDAVAVAGGPGDGQQLVSSAAAALADRGRAAARFVWPVVVDGTAGLVGGACCVLFGHPLDTAKVLMQAQSSTSRNFGTTTLGCLIEVLRTRGIVRGWYAGGGAALAANAAENALLFMSYGQITGGCDTVLRNPAFQKPWIQDNQALIKGAVSGSLAAFVTSMALCPIELIKVRVQTGEAASTFQCASNIIRQSGVGSLFNGLGATILREVPGNVAFFGTYEYCRSTFEARNMFNSEDARVLTAGGLGGIGFWLVALPADAIKTQQQCFRDSPSFTTATADIYRTQGIRGFYRGLIPVVVRAFPSNAALFWGVERTQALLGGFWDD